MHYQYGLEVARTKEISGVGRKFCSLFSLCPWFELVSTGFHAPFANSTPATLDQLVKMLHKQGTGGSVAVINCEASSQADFLLNFSSQISSNFHKASEVP